MPERIQLKRSRGWRLPENAVSVARPTRWGNPFAIGQRVIAPGAYGSLASPYHGCRASGVTGEGPRACEIRTVRTRSEAVDLFRSYVRHDPSGWPPGDIRWSLRGCDLACWCPLPAEGEPDICHGAVLLAISNGWEMPGA